MCAKSGPELIDEGEVLLRQVYPAWLSEDGEPSSQAFHPWRDVDEGCLSVDRGSMVSAAAAFARFTAQPPLGFGQPAVEVWGLSVGELRAKALSAWADPVRAHPPHPENPTHALVEFGDHPRARWSKLGKQLKVLAIARGRLHP